MRADLLGLESRFCLLQRSGPDISAFKNCFGFIASLGMTFVAAPDLFAMLRHRSSAGMNPKMAAIMGAF
jgi:hypothetical protein